MGQNSSHTDWNKPHPPHLGTTLLEGLRTFGQWPHPVGSIEIAETHISWVVLTGNDAYKIKKPVRFDFLDFSTLQLREFYCREELRLNRRYAPDLYLEVVPICGTMARPVIGGSGTPIEFAVRMRQFPAQSLLSEMLRRGELRPAHIDELAQTIARFHESAKPRDLAGGAATGYGSPQENERDARENFAELKELLDDRARLQEIEDWINSSLPKLSAAFQSRLEKGFVRECHGDLHLGNIIYWMQKVIPFDGVEFNERFRWVDMLSDAAFVAMDLQAHGDAPLAQRFANAYFEQTGDYAGLTVWRWYQLYRALVRSKVALLRASQSRDSAETQRLISENYLQLALDFIRPTSATLTITHGVSGSGKTFGTQQLLEEQGAFRIRSDVERKRLFGLSPGQHSASAAGQGIYTPDASERTYARLHDAAADVLAAGHSVIVDATFLKHAQRDRFRHLAKRFGVPFHILPFTAENDVLKERIQKRQKQGSDASDADLKVLEHQLRTMEPLTPDELAAS